MRRRRAVLEPAPDTLQVSAAVVRTLLSSQDELGFATTDLAESVDRVETSTRATATAAQDAATATAQVEQNAGMVAGAAAQISAAMSEVAGAAARAATVTGEAAVVTGDVRDSVQRLTTSTAQIEGVVRTVSGISDQTRMLALNATIEAARAGAAGRGFAVVAEEVQNLAALTSEATTQISDQLAALAADSDGVRRASERIDEVLRRIDELQQTIAAAVEEQTAAIAEITRSATETADAAQDLNRSVASSADAARAASSAVERSREWLGRVDGILERQRTEVHAIAQDVQVHPLRAAITAHGAWKGRLRTAIQTGRLPEGVEVAKAARSDDCAFGQWLLSGEGAAADAGRARPVADQHAAFHKAAAAVLPAVVAGRGDDARALLTDDRGYAGIAASLTDALTAWADAEARSGRA